MKKVIFKRDYYIVILDYDLSNTDQSSIRIYYDYVVYVVGVEEGFTKYLIDIKFTGGLELELRFKIDDRSDVSTRTIVYALITKILPHLKISNF